MRASYFYKYPMKCLAVMVFQTCFLTSAFAQNNLTLYGMHTLPQRIQVNPAMVSDSRFFIGFPGFSSLTLNYNNDGFKLKSLLSVNDANQLEVHPVKFYNALNKNNILNLNINYDLLHVGFKARKNFFTVGIGEKVKTQFSFPKDFFGLFIVGNAGNNLGKDLNFNFGYDLLAYNDLNASWSRGFLKEKLRLGAKLSYLTGWANINTEKSDLIFNTNTDDFHYTLRSNVKINTAGILDSSNNPNFGSGGMNYNFFKNKNRGLGFSLGATYQIIPKLVISASVVDVGYINWKQKVKTYQTADPSQKVEFYGVDFNRFFSDSVDFDKAVQELTDTLDAKFKMEEGSQSYRTTLPSNFYLGGNFWLTKRHNLGLLFYGNYYQKKLNPAITLSYNGKLTQVLGLSVSYSMINKSFVNGGIGFTLNLTAFQFYMIADNVLGMIKYRNANTVDFRSGINFTFLRKDKQSGLSGKKKTNKI